MKTKLLIPLVVFFLIESCVSTRKFNDQVSQVKAEKSAHDATKQDLSSCANTVKVDEKKIASLEAALEAAQDQISFLKQNNNQALKQNRHCLQIKPIQEQKK